MPLAAVAGYGEVTGLGDGPWVWCSADVRAVNDLLIMRRTRPARGAALQELADDFLCILERDGVIPTLLRDATPPLRPARRCTLVPRRRIRP